MTRQTKSICCKADMYPSGACVHCGADGRKPEKYKPLVCEHCGQTTTYALPLSRGVANIVIAVRNAILKKGVNVIHPMKEMVVMPWRPEDLLRGAISPNMYSNFRHATAHGLVAKVKGERGNYCMTHKGAEFLRDVEVDEVAVIDKVKNHQIGYLPNRWTSISKLLRQQEYWKGENFDIVEGRIVKGAPVERTSNAQGPQGGLW